MMKTNPAARAAASLLSILVAAPLVAQKPPEPRSSGGVSTTVEVTVTNIDVVVTDGKGNRVTGLKKEDFVVLEDGLQQAVTNFYAMEGGKVTIVGDEPVPVPTPEAAPAPATTPVSFVAPIPTPKTRLVLFVDNLHLTPFNRNRVLRNLEEWVKTAMKSPDVEAMVVTWDRSLKIRKRFTNDGRDVADVLKQIEGESAIGQSLVSERRDLFQQIDDSQSADQAVIRVRQFAESIANDLQFTFEALRTTMNQLSGVEGRKILVHVSEGLPQSPAAEVFKYVQDKYQQGTSGLQQFEYDKTSSYLGVVQAANAAGVTIYAFDARGLGVDSNVSAENKSTKGTVDTFAENANLTSMLLMMAEETGGVAAINRNDITLPLQEMQKDYASYYSIGYRSLRPGADRPHKVDVKVKRKGLTARARHSYVEKSVETRVSEGVVSALYFGRDDNPLGAAIEFGKPAPADRQNYAVPVTIRVPYSRITMLPDGPKVRGKLAFYFIVLDVSGKTSELATQSAPIEMTTKAFQDRQRGDFVYDVKMLMIPGGQKLSLAVRDEVSNTLSFVQKSIFVSALPPEDKPAGK